MNVEDLKKSVTNIVHSMYNFDCSEIVSLTRPPKPEYGDWALSLPLKLASLLKSPAIDIAQSIASALLELDGVQDVYVAKPGFINLKLSREHTTGIISEVLEQGSSFGRNTTQSSKKINLEFVSGNPTGPLHLAHTRWAAVGDSIARILINCGADVTREYYINNVGNQIHLFSESVYARALSKSLPKDGYPGEYVKDIARRIQCEFPNIIDLSYEDAIKIFRKRSWQIQIEEIKKSCIAFRVNFDVWFSEESLHEPDRFGKSQIDKALARCKQNGYLFQKNGAFFIRTTEFGDDKDRAVLRSDTSYTYYAADCAYYLNKINRGFSDLVILVGADHHGYVKRFQAMSNIFHVDSENNRKNVQVLLGQMVSLKNKRQSKREGNVIGLSEIIQSVGVDPLRFWFCRYPIDTPIDLDEQHLKKRSNDNPVYYVQYAYARTRSLIRSANLLQMEKFGFFPELLVHETETALVSLLYDYKTVVIDAARFLQPHRVVRYLESLAGAYHKWYDKCRIIPRKGILDKSEAELVNTRLELNRAVGQVLYNALDLIGVSAPERM
ncbi:MAG: arginine--tRNA ligase [Tropheryma whipplei]|uniref:arginine--tRNA ligase n=1 Tax=Tropheryma whipplei TaxID=2039 RepID=UPI0002DFF98E|nr:arginine--tRNA ligase [Tropheryma whipplei]MCO8182388.1 arginine--tRNA ligase [Tropheryma whipplei]